MEYGDGMYVFVESVVSRRVEDGVVMSWWREVNDIM